MTFDVPGSDSVIPLAINSSGDVTGMAWQSSIAVYHGFVRSSSGVITTFDIPNNSNFTQPVGINQSGEIVGYFSPASGGISGFLRSADGTLTYFSVPGFPATVPTGITDAGDIVGYCYSFAGYPYINHGFKRSSSGVFVTFDIPGATSTTAVGMTATGLVTGYYTAADGKSILGFKWTEDGFLQTFSAATAPRYGTFAVGINAAGTVVGYEGTNGVSQEGFILSASPSGPIGVFSVPHAFHTAVSGVNSSSVIAGFYYDQPQGGPLHGFLRDGGGTITKFDVPGAMSTVVRGINDAGVVTGSADSLGFLRFP